MTGREHLRDHPAHRRADDVRAPDAQRIEDPGGVLRHVVQRVRRVDRQAHQRAHHRDLRAVPARAARATGAAGIAVVEADDAQAVLDEALDELVGPRGGRHRKSHDQQHRRSGRVAEFLDVERQAVGENLHLEPGSFASGRDAGGGAASNSAKASLRPRATRCRSGSPERAAISPKSSDPA